MSLEQRVENLEVEVKEIKDEVKNHVRSDLRFIRRQVWGLMLALIGGLLGIMAAMINHLR